MSQRVNNDELAQLFDQPASDVPAVPLDAIQPEIAPSMSDARGNAGQTQVPGPPPPAAVAGPVALAPTTLDEPVLQTLARDVRRIYENLKLVLLPCFGRDQKHALRNVDLWGPLIFITLLAIIISSTSEETSRDFAVVFSVVGLGSVVLTLNVLLLGGRIEFLQSLSLLGYCLFPIVLGALICIWFNWSHWSVGLVRLLVIIPFMVWAGYAAVPFIGGAVPAKRRALAVYPVILLYVFMGWLVVVV